MELVEIIERQGNHIKKARLRVGKKDGIYYSISEAARQWQVTNATTHRWYESGKIDGIRDPMNDHLYVPEETVKKLRPENRFVIIE